MRVPASKCLLAVATGPSGTYSIITGAALRDTRYWLSGTSAPRLLMPRRPSRRRRARARHQALPRRAGRCALLRHRPARWHHSPRTPSKAWRRSPPNTLRGARCSRPGTPTQHLPQQTPGSTFACTYARAAVRGLCMCAGPGRRSLLCECRVAGAQCPRPLTPGGVLPRVTRPRSWHPACEHRRTPPRVPSCRLRVCRARTRRPQIHMRRRSRQWTARAAIARSCPRCVRCLRSKSRRWKPRARRSARRLGMRRAPCGHALRS